VTADGGREVLGFDVGDSEDGAFWTAFLRSLKARGLGGVQLVSGTWPWGSSPTSTVTSRDLPTIVGASLDRAEDMIRPRCCDRGKKPP
jgi:hypothetical protein